MRTTVKHADRLNSVNEYYFSKKLKEIALMNDMGKAVINLGIGNPDMPPPEKAIKTLCYYSKQSNSHGYQPYIGVKELRNNFASFYKKWYDVSLNPDKEIQPLIGSKEAILHITLAFINPGDKVLVPNPGYPTYSALSKLLGADVIDYNLREETNWLPNFEELEQMDLRDVKIMWVNYPNMPTGTNANHQLFEKLVQFAQRHQLIIVNDNPYSFILNNNPQSILSVEGAKECCIEINSMSKSHNMAGWRIGMVASNATFIDWILKVKSNIDSGMFKGIQMAAAEALEETNSWFKHNNITYAKRKRLAEELLKKLNCNFNENQVGMFLWAKIPNTYGNAIEFSDSILKRSNVFITPGSIFGSNGNQFVRLSLCTNEEKLREALQRISNFSL